MDQRIRIVCVELLEVLLLWFEVVGKATQRCS